MDNLTLFLGFAVVVGTIIVNGFIFRRQSRRIKDAEARLKEAEAKTSEFESFKKRIQFYDEQFERMKEMMVSKDAAIVKLSSEKCEVQKENERNKRAINKAISCKLVTDNEECPVLAQKRKDSEKTHKNKEK